MKELKDLQVGDTILVSCAWNRRLSKVQRVTKTLIVVDNIRFNRQSGWQLGQGRWNTSKLYVPTEKEIAKIKEEEIHKKLVYAIQDCDFRKLSTDKLKQVYNIIKCKDNEGIQS